MTKPVGPEREYQRARMRMSAYLQTAGLSSGRANANINALIGAVRELVASEIETASGRAPWMLAPSGRIDAWIDSRDAAKAAHIARQGLTEETL